MQFTQDEICEARDVLATCNDEELYLFFREVFDVVKDKLQALKERKKTKEPYQFRQNFPDIK